MLSNIKSPELLKNVVSYFTHKHLLKLINYNKSLQSKLSIKLDSYKKYAKIYRIFDNPGKGKEFDIDTNELKFEGEYKNKKKCGKGKEYSDGKLIFEGEYIDGLKNGYGKKYDEKDGKLIFEGKFLNGIEWEGKGMVKELDPEFGMLNITKANYYGEFKEGKINGEGKKIYTHYSKDGNYYEGNFVKGKKSGQGKEYFDFDVRKFLVYEGEFEDDKRNGFGKEYDKEGKLIFEGQFLNGQRWEGYGKEFNTIINKDKVNFEGEYKKGKRNGKGKEYFNNFYDNDIYELLYDDFNKNTIKFEGNYIDGEREGEGIEYFENGKIKFKGEYSKGKEKNGKGFNIKGEVVYEIQNGEGNIKEYDFRDHLEFDGEYKNYQYWNGKRSIYNKKGELKFELFYTEGMINQKKEYDENGQLTFEARYENGKINGKEYEKDELIFEGEYQYNKELDMLEAINFTIKSIFGTLSLKSTLIRWTGKGKEYNREGNLIYEGELFQGKKMEKEKNIMKKDN